MDTKRFVLPDKDIIVSENGLIRVFVPRAPHTHSEFGGHLVAQSVIPRECCTLYTAEEYHQAMAMVRACTDLMLHQLGAIRTNNQDNGNWFYLKPDDE